MDDSERPHSERADSERPGSARADLGPTDPEGSATVPAAVLAAFGLAGIVPAPLAGGQGTAWRAGPLVLKPAELEPAERWNADLFDELTGPGFRVPKPVRAATGDWIAHGWTAWRLVSGVAADWSGVSPRWPELIAGSRALHAALAPVRVPRWR